MESCLTLSVSLLLFMISVGCMCQERNQHHSPELCKKGRFGRERRKQKEAIQWEKECYRKQKFSFIEYLGLVKAAYIVQIFFPCNVYAHTKICCTAGGHCHKLNDVLPASRMSHSVAYTLNTQTYIVHYALCHGVLINVFCSGRILNGQLTSVSIHSIYKTASGKLSRYT